MEKLKYFTKVSLEIPTDQKNMITSQKERKRYSLFYLLSNTVNFDYSVI